MGDTNKYELFTSWARKFEEALAETETFDVTAGTVEELEALVYKRANLKALIQATKEEAGDPFEGTL